MLQTYLFIVKNEIARVLQSSDGAENEIVRVVRSFDGTENLYLTGSEQVSNRGHQNGSRGKIPLC